LRKWYFENKEDYDIFKEKFLSLFDSVNKYTKEQEEIYKSMLTKKLSAHKNYLESSLKKYDLGNTGFINFLQLRKILDNAEINLNDELIEYMIFLMKGFKHSEFNTLDQLKYLV